MIILPRHLYLLQLLCGRFLPALLGDIDSGQSLSVTAQSFSTCSLSALESQVGYSS